MSVKSKAIITISLLLGLLGFLAWLVFYYHFLRIVPDEGKTVGKVWSEKICLDFLTTKMSNPQGAIYTGYLDLTSLGEQTRGHDFLAESEGLMLLYYLEAGNKEEFNKHFNFIVREMILPHGLIGWRIVEGKLSPASAAVDDLRIVKALLGAYSRWGDLGYKNYALKIGKALKKYSTKQQILVDFYDSPEKAPNLTLAYVDLPALTMLAEYDPEWLIIKENCRKILEDSLISSELPLYKKTYYLKQQAFSKEDEGEVLFSLMVALSLSQDGQDVSLFLNWLKERLALDGAIYAQYNLKTQQPVSKMESTAIYALGALLAAEEQEQKLYQEMLRLMEKNQVRKLNSPIYGAFGNEKKLEVYSFDNLQALLAFQKGVKNGWAE